jgi:hypothetical protein
MASLLTSPRPGDVMDMLPVLEVICAAVKELAGHDSVLELRAHLAGRRLESKG